MSADRRQVAGRSSASAGHSSFFQCQSDQQTAQAFNSQHKFHSATNQNALEQHNNSIAVHSRPRPKSY